MIYVDQAAIKAEVFNPRTGKVVVSSWFHLFSSRLNPRELHEFAQSIGLHPSYFQRGMHGDKRDPAHDHYDVTIGKRRAAIRAGATSVNMEEAVELWRRKRALHERWLERKSNGLR
jgi:hypothetical protein